MPNVINVLNQLQSTILRKYNVGNESIFSTSFQIVDKDRDDDYEVPRTDNTPYVTHSPISFRNDSGNEPRKISKIKVGEQEEKEGEDPEAEEVEDIPEPDLETPEETPPVEEPEMPEQDFGGGGDLGGADAGMGGDMGMGTPGEEEKKTSTELGRIYELKKIYARLTAIESYLGNESDPELLEVRKYVSQGIELFEVISSNFDSFKGKVDEIIIMYYKFLKEAYETVRDFYKKISKNDGG